MFYLDYNSFYWRLIEYLYTTPEAPPQTRDPNNPLQIIAVGFSRSGTESLQTALIKLGYTPCYHGWDLLFGTSGSFHNQAWVRLCRKKWYSTTGDCQITAEEFDEIVGHACAITDVPASAFAMELIEAYPEAKVIINQRRDMEAWYASSNKNIVENSERMWVWFLTWWDAEFFWMYNVFERYLYLRSGRATNGWVASGLKSQGKWVFREHMHAVRGLLWSRGEGERLLDWYVEDGWDKLCEFLGKEVPDEPFPRTNNAAGFEGRADAVMKRMGGRAIRNLGVFCAVLVAAVSSTLWYIW